MITGSIIVGFFNKFFFLICLSIAYKGTKKIWTHLLSERNAEVNWGVKVVSEEVKRRGGCFKDIEILRLSELPSYI
jgi:hypothetical protein